MNTTREILASRYSELKASKSSIESDASNNTSSIELPEEIENLITGPDAWKHAKRNRYKMLIRQGYLATLLQLARMAHKMATQQHPSHWFAKWASKAQWERTLKTLAERAKVQRTAERIATMLSTTLLDLLYKQIWSGASVERWAGIARETPHNQPGQSRLKHFLWLCRQEKQTRLAYR